MGTGDMGTGDWDSGMGTSDALVPSPYVPSPDTYLKRSSNAFLALLTGADEVGPEDVLV